jgi:hypothetical protein
VRAQKRDQNEPAVVAALEDMGYIVERCYAPMPFDLLVRRQPPAILRLPIEVKTPAGSLTPSQEKALAEGAIIIVRSPDEALAAAARYL